VKILIVSATEKEIIPLINSLKAINQLDESGEFLYKSIIIDILVTGVGSVFTTYSLLQKLTTTKYDLVINAGIAGSFDSDLNVGDVVIVKQDQFADLGIEDENSFSTLFEKGFISKSLFPFENGVLINTTIFSKLLIKEITPVTAITVNTTHGREESIYQFKEKFCADIETMEGAAFFYVCLQQKVPFIQLRAISNYVKPRKFAKWDIAKAIENLNAKLFEILVVLEKDQTIK